MGVGKHIRVGVAVLGLMFVAGCKGGDSLSELFNAAGSLTSSLFGGGSTSGSGNGSGSGSQIASNSGPGGSGGDSGSGAGDSTVLANAAVVHQPEPASLALFAGGLASLAMYRRRAAKGRRHTKRAHSLRK